MRSVPPLALSWWLCVTPVRRAISPQLVVRTLLLSYSGISVTLALPVLSCYSHIHFSYSLYRSSSNKQAPNSIAKRLSTFDTGNALVRVKHVLQRLYYRRVIRIRLHQISHVGPPLLHDG